MFTTFRLLCSRAGFAGVVLAALGAKEPAARGEAPPQSPDSESTLKKGRELFARVWTPKDPRSHGGDGLGPVFNAQSCVACHDRGGTGGAGSAERNIDIATAAGGPGLGAGFGFAYSFGMGMGPGGFEYKFVSNAPNARSNANAARREPPLDARQLASVHPGFRSGRSVVLHRFGVDPAYHAWRESVPGPHGTIDVRISQRNPTPLFGAGLIDAIPDEAIEAAAKRKGVGSARVKGRVARLPDGRVGRFGWKAQTARLEEFVLSAAATEMGLEVPGHHQAGNPRLPGLDGPGLDMNESECEALVAFVRSLPAPVVVEPTDAKHAANVKAGESSFRAIGCADCHLPRLGGVEGIYSDLLLHDMSPKLADTGDYSVFLAQAAGANGPAPVGGPRAEGIGAKVQEWRTSPLWGLRDSAPYMHDGRAETVEDAIAAHGGQGASSAQRYSQLSARRKQQLEAFLLSLSAPRRSGDGARGFEAD